MKLARNTEVFKEIQFPIILLFPECLFGRAPYHSSTFKELETKLTRNTPIEVKSCQIPDLFCVLRPCLFFDNTKRGN